MRVVAHSVRLCQEIFDKLKHFNKNLKLFYSFHPTISQINDRSTLYSHLTEARKIGEGIVRTGIISWQECQYLTYSHV